MGLGYGAQRQAAFNTVSFTVYKQTQLSPSPTDRHRAADTASLAQLI